MSMSAPIPMIDVTEAERRLREDAPAPLLLDVREMGEFLDVRAPGAALVPTSTFMTRLSELPADRPHHVVCHHGGRYAAGAGYRVPARRTAGGKVAGERAGLPVRRGPLDPGEGELPAG